MIVMYSCSGILALNQIIVDPSSANTFNHTV